MGTTLAHGIYLPSEGERNCYAGLKLNWETLDQKVADISALQSAIAGALHREIVESLPTTDIDPNTIYMILSGTSATENVYNEFMYVNNAWELIGTSATDLANYYTKAEVDGKLLLKASTSDLTSHTGDATIHVTTADKNRWNNNTYVFRYSSTALVASSTNSNTLLDNTDNLKVGDKVIDSNGVLFSITAIDSVNSTFTIGTALIDLAQDSGVMHLSGNETADGLKRFLKYITSNGSTTGDEYSSNAKTNLWLMGNRDTEEVSGVLFDTYRQNTAQGTGIHILGIGIKENSVRYEGCRWGWYWDNNLNGYTFDFKPNTQGNKPLKYNLGTSIDKWDTINGLNPSSLSLPDLSNGIDISGYINTGDSDNSYTPTVDGYISVRVNGTNSCALYALQGDVNTSSYGNIVDVDLGGFICSFFIPVVKNVACKIVCRRVQTIVSAKFIPCQGNV